MKKLKIGFYIALSALIFASCSDDAEDNNGAIEQELTQTEVQSILETDEVTSVVDNALAELYEANTTTGKFSSPTASSNECYSAEYTENGFTATFNNCVLNSTDNVNGTLVVTYGVDGSTASYTATYEDFFVGDIKVNGTRTFTLIGSEEESSVSFSITSNISIEFEDGETVSENGTKTFAIIFEEGQDTLWNLSGNWTVQVDGNTYAISGDVSKNFICEYWTQGIMTVTKNGLGIDVDFGDGTCDDQATVIYPNGATEDISL